MGRIGLHALLVGGLAVGLVLPRALADSRGVFVSPATGVAVGSVWGVFVGVSEYQQQELNLRYADQDAKALHAFFVQQFQGRIPADQFRVLTNAQATRGRILKEVGEVLRRAQPEDLVILFLALHGLPDMSGQDLYFLAHDADANLPEDRGLSRDDLLKQIQRSKVRKIVLLLDACHAGGFGASSTLLAMRNAHAADINRMLVAMGQAQDGIAVLTAASAAERSQEGPQFCGGHGAFTCALLTGLQGAADSDRNGLVQVRELYDYTYRETKRSTTGYQNPELQGRFDNGLPLATTGTGLGVAGGPPAGSPAPPPGKDVDVGGYDRLDEERRLAEKREQAWAKVQGFATDTRIMRERRLAALDQFLADFPDDNPHVAEVEALKQQVNAEIQVAKAPAYAAPQQAGREITGRDGAPMVLVPKGEFLYGADNRRLSLPAFSLDKFEVTTALYARFMAATGRVAPQDWEPSVPVSHGQKPVVGVTWHDADAYCRYYGKRLPTEQEWEKAARGTDGRTYPWGNEAPTRRHANFDRGLDFQNYGVLVNVGSLEDGKSPYGIYDLAGNVWEWTSSDYDNSNKVVRGGSWLRDPSGLVAAYRFLWTPDDWYSLLGFRCAQDAR
ncbi:SUMF1/EgtB/PvdO family nonheme iron enzyme [Nitrospira sp. Kam-Ns4a]